MSFSKFFFALLLIAVVLSQARDLFALTEGEFVLTPYVIDRKAKVRGILKETITLKNNTERKLTLFPTVNDIDSVEGKEEFISAQNARDRSASLANWIELSRGEVEILPGEQKEVPFVIRVNMNAIPGTYHAVIMFAEGSTRDAAEKAGSDAKVAVNLEIEADVKEIMQLNKFNTDSVFISGDDVVFNYQLENIGNQNLTPKGEIRIYDRKGQEVAAIPVNENGKSFSPDEMVQLASAWNASNGFGKYKAFLNIDYGNEHQASVYDTIYFWIFPWQQLLGMFMASFIIIIGFAFYFHRWLERRQIAQAVIAGAHGGSAFIAVPTTLTAPPGSAPTVPTQKSQEDTEGPYEEPKRFTLSILKWKMFFSAFLRGKKKFEKKVESTQVASVPGPVLQASVVPTPVEAKPKPLKETFGDIETIRRERSKTQAHTHKTINLKQFSSHERKEHHPHHVVNLKK